MKNKILTLMLGLLLIGGISGVYAYDASTPYTASMKFIVGSDTSFTVQLAGAETTIDFNPVTANSKNVQPDSQNASTTTPIAVITNTGNINLNFTQKVNATMPTFVNVSYNTAATVDWTKLITSAYSTISTSISPASSSNLYMWANFTDATLGTAERTYQINSTAS